MPYTFCCTEFETDKGKVEHILQILLQLCQRSASKVDDKMRENMWLSTLELVLSLPRKRNTQNSQLVEGKEERERERGGERKRVNVLLCSLEIHSSRCP